jgi:hypothetical protein
MNELVMPYRILHHVSGCIYLEVPSLTRFSWLSLFKKFRKEPPFQMPSGIKSFLVNPSKRNVTIRYEPTSINILEYIEKVTLHPEVKEIMGW